MFHFWFNTSILYLLYGIFLSVTVPFPPFPPFVPLDAFVPPFPPFAIIEEVDIELFVL